jgi:DNA-binding MarR family transcriptional regulator
MGVYGSRDTARAALERDLEALVRRLTVESQRLAHAFAERHGLHATDLEALIHVMDAEGRGAPLTPGDLSAVLRITSGATTAVVDRLERHQLVRRDRDDADRRKVHLRFADHGQAIAMEFFGGLQQLNTALMAQFTDDDLETVRRFMTQMGDMISTHRSDVEHGTAGQLPAD